MKDDMTGTLFKTLPGVVISVWTYIFNMPLEKWVLLATLIHIVLQVILMLRREWRRRFRDTDFWH